MIRVYVGASEAQWLPFKVLEHSIKSKSTANVEVFSLDTWSYRVPKVPFKTGTPFSLQRFLIPSVCDYKWQGVYLDSDMLVLSDISELAGLPFGEADVLSPPKDKRGAQFAVMVIQCDRLKWDIDQLVKRVAANGKGYKELMTLKGIAKVSQTVPPRWNHLDKLRPDTKLLHYTDMTKQPWLKAGHPHADLWLACLASAVRTGKITLEQISREVGLRHVRAGVYTELEKFL